MPGKPPVGCWAIDPGRSHVGFSVRRRGMTPLQARFTSVSGHLDVADQPADSRLELVVATSALECRGCDDHLRSAEHLDVARHPTATLRSTGFRWAGTRTRLRGRLTIVGVTNELDLDVEYRSVGGRGVFAGTGSIDREAWGLTWNVTLAGGQPLVERLVHLQIELAARAPIERRGVNGRADYDEWAVSEGTRNNDVRVGDQPYEPGYGA